MKIVRTPSSRRIAGHRAHRRMQLRREEKRDAGAAQHVAHPRGIEIDVHAERGEDVGAAARRRHRAVAVLGHRGAGAGGNDRGDRRHVERAASVAAGAAGVDDAIAIDGQRRHALAHRQRGAGDLVRGLALHPQRDEQRAFLHVGGAAVHHFAEHFVHFVAPEVLAVDDALRMAMSIIARTSARKFAINWSPPSVPYDSGWNWIP